MTCMAFLNMLFSHNSLEDLQAHYIPECALLLYFSYITSYKFLLKEGNTGQNECFQELCMRTTSLITAFYQKCSKMLLYMLSSVKAYFKNKLLTAKVNSHDYLHSAGYIL